MVELEVLVGEHPVPAVDGLAAGSVEVDEIASLDHELWDDPVEDGSLVVERLPELANAFLPCIPKTSGGDVSFTIYPNGFKLNVIFEQNFKGS